MAVYVDGSSVSSLLVELSGDISAAVKDVLTAYVKKFEDFKVHLP